MEEYGNEETDCTDPVHDTAASLSGTADYDVIFPTDYMIARMAEGGLLAPLNYDNIPRCTLGTAMYKPGLDVNSANPADWELAERFINFMLSQEIAIANAEYISYACPNRLVYENEQYRADMGREAMSILYPETGSFLELYNRCAYRNLTLEQMDLVNSLREKVKVS